MPEKTTKKAREKNQEIMFKCKFCGETKPFSEMVLMRQYFPHLPACKVCSRVTKSESQTQPENILEQDNSN
jgi:transcription elongation factor Elf1